MSKLHAKLSASGSATWLNCPGSINACKDAISKTNSAAEEGTLAHELADICLKAGEDSEIHIGLTILGKVITKEMATYVQEYLDYVRSFEDNYTRLLTEQRVDFSKYIPNGFGTMDAAVVSIRSSTAHIFDLKYGFNEVSPVENTQGMLYAIGLYLDHSWLYDMKTFVIHIVQPRIKNFSSWEITLEDLIKFAEYASERAAMVLDPNAKRVAGEKQCRWCDVSGNCKTEDKYLQDIIGSEFDKLDEVEVTGLDNSRIRLILDNKKAIESFLEKVEENAFDKLTNGEELPGYKIVEGRSDRKSVV